MNNNNQLITEVVDNVEGAGASVREIHSVQPVERKPEDCDKKDDEKNEGQNQGCDCQ